ncbi:MAG: tetratricopeptide repeat protein [Candidatus Zixiibacteriota bacterium]
MDLTGYGWTIFWVVAFGVAGAAMIWTRTQKRRVSQAPRLYTEALRALVEGEDQIAFERLKAVATEDSGNVDAYLKLGDLLRRRGRVDRAIRVHEDLTMRLGLPKPDAIAVQRSLAQDYVAAGNHAAAESSLRKILELDRENRWAADQLVKLCEEAGRFDEAYEVRREALKRAGQSDGHQLALFKALAGIKLDNSEKGHDARLLYKDALGHDPKCLPALLYLGDSYWKEGRLDDAIEWWSKFAEIEPKASHVVFERLRKGYFELGQFGEITKVYERTLDADSKNVPAILGLAELSLKKGDLDTALSHYRHVLDIDENNISARAGMVRVLLEQKRWREVSHEVQALLDTTPFHRPAYRCKKCDHALDEPAWQCPKCRAVDTITLY